MAILYNQLRDNFTQIPNELLTDSRLSNGAKVVYCYVASKPTGWKVWNTEIQQSLNIKDSGTMSKYWKELIETGWIDRTRTKSNNGQFSGGYDYELRITPIEVKTHIGEKPSLGENPIHSNTNLDSNTNINNNTISNNNSIISNTPNGQLFNTSSKPKKTGENQYTTVIEKLSSNQNIRNALQKYLAYRRKKGLTIEQWETIVTRFKNDTKEKCKSVDEAVDAIERCLMDGNMKLFYKDYNNIKNPTPPPVVKSTEPSIDNVVYVLTPENILYKEFYFDLEHKPTKLDPNYMPILYVFEDGRVLPDEKVDKKYKR